MVLLCPHPSSPVFLMHLELQGWLLPYSVFSKMILQWGGKLRSPEREEAPRPHNFIHLVSEFFFEKEWVREAGVGVAGSGDQPLFWVPPARNRTISKCKYTPCSLLRVRSQPLFHQHFPFCHSDKLAGRKNSCQNYNTQNWKLQIE